MPSRIHLIVDREEKERYRRQAEREGKSLSGWLREAARAKLAEASQDRDIETLDELREFFAECDRREQGREPDWPEHRRMIERSMRGESTP